VPDIDREKRQVHELIERLAPSQVIAVRGVLEALLEVTDIPLEDQEITSEMAVQLDRARASLNRGEGIPHDEILREFGLTPR
jgi:hypothetical protein